MTYKQALAIRTAIEKMNAAFEKNFSAACLPSDPDNEDEGWEVFLYSDKSSELDYLALHQLSIALCEMFAIPYFYSSYDAGTMKNSKTKKSFRLW